MGKKLTVTIEEYANVDETFQNIKNIKVGSMTLNDLFGDNLKVIENALEERKKLLKWKDSQQDLIKGKDEYIAKLCNDRAVLKAELNGLREFASLMAVILDLDEKDNQVHCNTYFYNWTKGFDLVKKVVEKYGQ